MLIYIEDLSYDNFKEYEKDIKNSINEIIRIEEMDLTSLSAYVGVSRQTLYKYFRHNSNISFRSLNKMNNFLKRYKEKLDEVKDIEPQLVESDIGFISIESENGSIN